MKNKKNEGKTPEQVVAERVALGKEARASNKVHLLKRIDQLITYLQDNRECIAGVSVVLVADQGTALYDREDNDASEGLAFRSSLSGSTTHSMDKHLQEMIDGVGGGDGEDHADTMPDFLHAMLAGGAHIIDGGKI